MQCKNLHLYVNSISYPITNLGPGKRIVLWLEGCSLGCKGCMAVSMQKRNESHKKPLGDVIATISSTSTTVNGITGITISGGEPFEQPEALYELVRVVNEETNLDVMVYSGYTRDELEKQGKSANKLLGMVDILIDGRFEESATNKKIWRGSDNQCFHILSERAKKYSHYINAEYGDVRELCVEPIENSRVKIVGIPDRKFLKILNEKCKKAGFVLTQKT